MIVDTSALLAFFDTSEPDHGAVTAAIAAATGPLVISPYVLAELDYLLATRLGVEPELAVLSELAGGAWDLASFGAEDLGAARDVIERYRDQQIGVADASIVVLASQRNTHTILTLDHRHFEVLRPLDGGRFRILP